MKLLAIRNFNEQDPLPPLGPKHEPPKPADSAPAPAPVPGRPGIIRHPDGKLSTDLPKPPKVALHDSTVEVGPPKPTSPSWFEAIRLGQELEITSSGRKVRALKKHANGKHILVRRLDGIGSPIWVDCDLLG